MRNRGRPELLRLLELISPTDRRVMAQLWGAPGALEAAALAAVMTDAQAVERQLGRLSAAERAALDRVLQGGGALPAAILQREYGPLREPAKFEHPRAYLQALQSPATPSERLYAMGLLVRGHDERGALFRVPNDLVSLLPEPPPRELELRVPPAAGPPQVLPGERVAEELLLTLEMLAYAGELTALEDGAPNKAGLVRLGKRLRPAWQGSTPYGERAEDLRSLKREADWPALAWTRSVAAEAGLLRRGGDGLLRPTPQALAWLSAPRAERVRTLLEAYVSAPLDELVLLAGLRWRGGAPYTIARAPARRTLLSLLGTLPAGEWLPLDAIAAEIRRVEPDFLRRDGRYDTWLLYDGERLVSSWEDWLAVEGRLVRETIRGPLHWLALFELDQAGELARLTPLGAHVLSGAAVPAEPPAVPLVVQGTYEVLVPPGVSSYARFQLARFAEYVPGDGAVERYRLTRRALLAALERGAGAGDVIAFLEKHASAVLPPAVVYTLREWGGKAEQVRVAHAVLLDSDDPVIMAQLAAGKFGDLGNAEQLGPALLRLTDGQADALVARLRAADVGVRDERIDVQLPIGERDLRAVVAAAAVYNRLCAELGWESEVSPAMLQRLLQLVPQRAADAALQAAERVAMELAPKTRTIREDTRSEGKERE